VSEVLFGQAYSLRFDPKLWAAMQPYPPLGTLYAASYLRNRGVDVAVFDSMLAQSEHEWSTALDDQRPRIVVLYEDNFNYLTKMCLLRMREAAFTMIRSARDRDCTVIVAGSDPTDQPEQYLDQGAHFVLLGEGEASLGELIDRLPTPQGGGDYGSIPGLAYHDPDGGIRLNPRRPPIADLDALPFPAWDLVDIPRYRDVWTQRHGYFSLNMVTTRGCPYHCNWCAKPLWGQRYNVRSPENVAAELRLVADRYDPDHIWFMDDIMGLVPGWWQGFADALENADVRVPFKCLSRPDLLLRDGEIDAMARAGCDAVWMGAESGSQKILDAMEKGTRVEQIREASLRLRARGIRVAFFLQFGYPGETRDDVEKTLQMVRDCRPDDIGMSVSYPLPGTKFHERVEEQLGAKRHWVDSEDLDMMYRGPFASPFYRKLHTVLHREFRARRTGRRLLPLLRHPLALRPRNVLEAGGALLRWSLLPLDRLHLAVLARRRHRGIGTLPTALSPEQAAEPSPHMNDRPETGGFAAAGDAAPRKSALHR